MKRANHTPASHSPAHHSAKPGMRWGYYCRTCGVNSPLFYSALEQVILDLGAMEPEAESLAPGEEFETFPTINLAVAIFLTQHSGHDLWAQCESGVLWVQPGAPPAEIRGLPMCVHVNTMSGKAS